MVQEVDPNLNTGDISTNEQQKFTTTNADEVAVRIRGESTPSGLRTAIRNRTLTVGTTATPLPAIALVNRNSMSVHNKDALITLYVGPSDVTADDAATTGGKEIDGDSEWALDITDDIILYGRVSSGFITIKITEFA